LQLEGDENCNDKGDDENKTDFQLLAPVAQGKYGSEHVTRQEAGSTVQKRHKRWRKRARGVSDKRAENAGKGDGEAKRVVHKLQHGKFPRTSRNLK
jgi:hypothetical protein